MGELLSQLGIDWRLLLSQAANFLILLIVLRLFAYKPVMKMLKDRRTKIEEGVKKAEEADQRLHEANLMAKDKLKEADKEALEVLRQTELKAKKLEEELVAKAHSKENEILENAQLIIQAKAEEARHEIHEGAAEVIRAAIIKTVELDPKHIDDTLITKAARSVK